MQITGFKENTVVVVVVVSFRPHQCSLIWVCFSFTWQTPNHPVTAAVMKQCCRRRPESYWWLLKWKCGTFPLFSAALHRINCRIHTEILTFAHITGACRCCCCFLYRRSSHRLLWYPRAPGARLKQSVFFPWKINKGHSGGSLEAADEKKHGSERRSSVDPAHLFKRACDRCITWANGKLIAGRYMTFSFLSLTHT